MLLPSARIATEGPHGRRGPHIQHEKVAIVICARGVRLELVDLSQAVGVVGGGESEVLVEAPHDGEWTADAEVAVEIHDAGHHDVRFVVSRRPCEVGIA